MFNTHHAVHSWPSHGVYHALIFRLLAFPVRVYPMGLRMLLRAVVLGCSQRARCCSTREVVSERYVAALSSAAARILFAMVGKISAWNGLIKRQYARPISPVGMKTAR